MTRQRPLRFVLDDPRIAQQLQHPVAHTRVQPPRRRLAGGDGSHDRQPVLVQQPHPLHNLLHRRAVPLQRALEAEPHQVEVDLPHVQLDRGQVRLLGDPHRRARVCAAQLDDPVQGRLRDRAVVGREALRQPPPPLLLGDRPQRIEAAEAAERTARRGEQVAHHVLDAAGEEVRDGGRALEHGPHPVGDRVRVPVRPARRGDLLELVEEQDQAPPVGRGHSLGQLERQVQRALGVLRGEPRRQRQLDPLPQLADQADHRARLRGRERRAPGAPSPPQRAVGGGAVGDHRRRQRLRELRGVGDPEQVDLRRVGAAPPGARKGGLAHARLPRPPRSGDDQVGARLESRGNLAHVVAPPDQLTGRYGRVGREEVATRLSHLGKAYTYSV